MSEDANLVSYTVKELLADIRSKLDHMDGKLDGKADKHAVEELHQRIDTESARIDSLEREQEHTSRVQSDRQGWRSWAYPSIAAAVPTMALVAVTVFHR